MCSKAFDEWCVLALIEQRDGQARVGEYERAARTRDELLQVLREKARAIAAVLAEHPSLASTINAAVDAAPGRNRTPARFLLALIRSDPTLAARLAPLLPEIERTLNDRPPNEGQ